MLFPNYAMLLLQALCFVQKIHIDLYESPINLYVSKEMMRKLEPKALDTPQRNYVPPPHIPKTLAFVTLSSVSRFVHHVVV